MNHASNEPFDFGEFSLRLLLCLLVGLSATIVFTFLLFSLGFSISAYHAFLGLLPAFTIAIILGRYRKHLLMALVFIAVLVCANSYWAKHIYGVNWDGMLTQKDVLMAFEKGWNPIKDPYFEKGLDVSEWENQVLLDKLTWSGFSTKFGFIYRAINASIWKNTEAAKGINVLFLVLPFLAAYYGYSSFGIGRIYAFILSKITALNPIILFQLFTFWEDIYFVSAASVALLLSISFLRRVNTVSIVVWLLSLVLLFGIKKSGVAFAAFIVGFTFLVMVLSVRRSLRFWVISVSSAAAAMVIMLILGSQLGLWRTGHGLPFKLDYISKVNDLSYILQDSGRLEIMPIYDALPGPFKFLANSFSEASMVVQGYQFKWPFEITRAEFEIISNTFPGLWMGGFGPWFGLGLILTIIGCIGILLTYRKVSWGVVAWTLGLWLLLLIQPSYFARWIGHLWLLPLLLVLATLAPSSVPKLHVGYFSWAALKRQEIWRQLSFLGLIVLMINSMFIACLNVLGHARSSDILNQQFEYIKSYTPQPTPIAFRTFPSNRDWLDARDLKIKRIDWSELSERGNYMVLHRTDTLIDLGRVNFDEPITIQGKEWRNFKEWIDYLNSRSGTQDKWIQWIPLLYQPSPEAARS